jgi:L-alanine-DL-glutamate epimerase-like enolase superfamily enzyme
MKITKLEPIILHAPVTRGGIADSTHKLSHWGAPGVAIHTDTGHIGYGFSGTHAHLATDRLIAGLHHPQFWPAAAGRRPARSFGALGKAAQAGGDLLGGPRGHHASGARRD